MYKNYKIGVVVPAYNEELLILETLQGMPNFADAIFVVNDGSKDNTLQLVQNQQKVDGRIVVVNHKTNKGLGQSLIDGYLASLDSNIDLTTIMAGDNQMHPDDLPNLLDKLIDEGFDYVKGNRLLHQDVSAMPRYRFVGNAILTILTKFATGYYSLMDPQSGYTAIKNSALRNIPIATMTKGYGYNADILCMLNIRGYKVADVQIQPVYDREISKIKLWKYIPKTSWLLVKLFFRRLWQRYIVRDFHPLVLFYLFAIFNTVFFIVPLTIRFFYLYYMLGEAPQTTLIILVFFVITTFQSILFAIWMDMDYNRPM
ncbi:MAG: glycosyltransferase family 2 protein [Deltaproteobacteria bacterium]|nr:glycosyltransferase family 2 protein [Deltaproteobacteria bacterium]